MANLNLGSNRLQDKTFIGTVDLSNKFGIFSTSTEKTLGELTTAFSNGEIDVNTFKGRLASLNITPVVQSNTVTFTYNKKVYSVKQVISASSNSTYSASTLKDIYKFSDDVINTYFKQVDSSQLTSSKLTSPKLTSSKAPTNGTLGTIGTQDKKYVINTATGYKNISQIQNLVYQQCQKDMVVANFLNDKNRKTNSTSAMLKAQDGKTITKYNYQDYVDGLKSTLGTDTTASRQKALNKFITDFSQGNVAYSISIQILGAIGVQNVNVLNTSSSYTISFKANNKTYKISCNAKAAQSGTDSQSVITYPSTTIEKYNASKSLVNKYFDTVATENSNALTYALKTGRKFEEFVTEAKLENQPKVKNGVYTTTNSKGNKVETTYKDDKITKEVEYKGTSSTKLSMTTYNSDGGKTVTNYKDGKVSADYTYDKSGKLITSTSYNTDGSKTVTNYKDGNVTATTKYDKNGNVVNEGRPDGEYTTTNANGNKVVTTYKNGKVVSEIIYKKGSSSKKETETNYTYDSNGLASKTVIEYDNQGYKEKETVTDKNGNKLSETKYTAIWTDPVTGTVYNKGTYPAIITTTYNGSKTTETIKINDGKTMLRETITDSDKNTKTVVSYTNGKKTGEITYDLTGNKLSEVAFDQNGKTLYTRKYNNSDSTETITFANGSTSTIKNGATTAELKDVSGNIIGKTVKTNMKVSLGTTSDEIFSNTKYNCLEVKNNSGETTQRFVYENDGSIKTVQTFTYEYTDSKNYKVIIKDSDGNTTHTEVYENGKKTVTYHYFNSTKSTIVEEEGKGSARSRLSGSVKMEGQTMSAQTFYDIISNPSARTGYLYTGYGLVKIMGGDISVQLLKMAQTSYSDTPSGCDKKYTGYSQLDSAYRETVKTVLADTLKEYGISAEQAQGYHFPATSSISTTMASSSYLKDFVKNNIKDLINGNCSGKSFEFKSGDLYYSFQNVSVINSKLNGTKLTLTLFDIYDFNGNCSGNSNAAVFNRAGNAAMKDGKLKPYYTLTEVTIDLTSLGFTAAQIQAMKN